MTPSLQNVVGCPNSEGETMHKKYTVYSGNRHGKIVYIGTTTQEPEARFRWHRSNGKKLCFNVIAQFETAEEMLAEEFRLIQKHLPCMNKIKHRAQNLNVALTGDAIDSRRGNAEWCQSCLKRRVNAGYKFCLWCSKTSNPGRQDQAARKEA